MFVVKFLACARVLIVVGSDSTVKFSQSGSDMRRLRHKYLNGTPNLKIPPHATPATTNRIHPCNLASQWSDIAGIA